MRAELCSCISAFLTAIAPAAAQPVERNVRGEDPVSTAERIRRIESGDLVALRSSPRHCGSVWRG